MSPQDFTIFALKVIFTLAAILLIVVYAVRPILRSLNTRPDFLDDLNKYEVSADLEEEELDISTEGATPDRQSLLEEARSDPHRATAMVRGWLKERK